MRRPDERGGRGDPLTHDQRRARRPAGASGTLRRSDDRRIAGIAAGVARFTGASPATVRALFLLSIPLSLGITIGGYLILWGLLPGPERP